MGQRSHQSRLTCAAAHSEAVAARGALVAAAADHVGFAVALTSDLITLSAEGALRVALTGWTQPDTNDGEYCIKSAHRAASCGSLPPLTQGAIMDDG